MPFGPIAYGRKASRTHEARWYLYTNTNEKKSRGPLDVRYIPSSYPVTGTRFFSFVFVCAERFVAMVPIPNDNYI